MLLSEWVPKEQRGELPMDECLVDAILAERRRSKKREFIAKWKARPKPLSASVAVTGCNQR